MVVEASFYLSLIVGGAIGSSHPKFIENGRLFPERMKVYGGISLIGFFFLLISTLICDDTVCKDHAIPILTYLISAFAIGLGVVGSIVNFSSRGTARDPDHQMMINAANNIETNGIALSSATSTTTTAASSSYQPVALQESDVL